MTEFVYFALGLATSVVLSPFVVPKVQQWGSTRSAKAAAARGKAIRAEHKVISEFHARPGSLNTYLLARLLLLNVLWVADGVIGSFFTSVTNGTWTVAVLNTGVSINVNQMTTIVDTVAAVVSVVLLAITFRVGLRAYRIWRNVQYFDTYVARVEREIESLRQAEAKLGSVEPESGIV